MGSGLQTVLLTGVVALAAGVGLGVLLDRPGEGRTAAPVADGGAAAAARLEPLLGELERTLAELTRVLEAGALTRPVVLPEASAAGAGRTPVVDSADRSAELVATLQSLAGSLRRLEASAGSPLPVGDARHPLIVPSFVDRRAAFAALAVLRQASISDDSAAYETGYRDLKLQYLNWTSQMVLNTFGKPDEINDDRWEYELHNEDESSEGLYFKFNDGLVSDADYDYDAP